MDTKDFDVVAMRTDLHQIPELGFNEHKTSDYVAAKLKEMGLEPIRGFIENQTFDVLDVPRIEIAVMIDSSNIVVFI